MVKYIYNFFLGLFALVSLPKVLLKKEKYQKSLRAKLGLELPKPLEKGEGVVCWIHAVSVGETKAAIPLLKKIKAQFPTSIVVVSSTTETGHEEAKRSLKDADSHFFLPLDFSWTMEKLVSLIKPDVLILMEGEFWFNLVQEAKKQGAAVVLANGKLSEISLERFSLLPFFTKRLFAPIDHLCLQSADHLERFEDLGVHPHKMTVTGNLKLDTPMMQMTPSEKDYWKEELGIIQHDRILTIGSTHPGEEELILDAMKTVWKELPDVKLLLVPRHPERFEEVAQLLEKRKAPFVTYTSRREKNRREKVILIDTMGFLTSCFQLAEVTVVGGSFIRGVGGHNIFEPIQCGKPVIFGPHMESQRELTALILKAEAGLQVSVDELPGAILDLFQNGNMRAHMLTNGDKLQKSAKGALKRTWDSLTPFLSV